MIVARRFSRPRIAGRPTLAAGRVALACALSLLGACMSNPVPPPVVDRTGAPSAAAEPAPAQLPAARALHDGLPPDGHVVQPGDTLYGIAWRYNLDYRALAERNRLVPPYRIVVGQRLLLGAPAESGPVAATSGALAGVAPVPATVPAEPSSRGFEFVPDSPAGQDAWQDMPPPSPVSPGVAMGLPDERPSAPAPIGPEPGFGSAPVAPSPASSVAAPQAPAAPIETVAPRADVALPPAPAAPAPQSVPQGSGGWRWPTGGSVQKAFGNGNKGIDFKLDAGQPVVAASSGDVVYAGNGLGGFRHLVIIKHDQRFLSAYSLNQSIAVKEGERVATGHTIAGPDGTGGTLRFEIRRDGQPVDPKSVIDR